MKIDVHAHYVPDGYRSALLRAGYDKPDGMPWLPEWSADKHVEVMDRLGIATSLLSVSSPGVHLGDGAATIDLAREVNEDGRRAVVDHRGGSGCSPHFRCRMSTRPSPRSHTAATTSTSMASCCSPTSVAPT